MKIKSLFIAALAFTTFTSCSSDEDFKDNESMNEVDASVSLMVTANDLLTRSSVDAEDENGTEKERSIETLTLYVFNAGGNFVNHKTVTNTTVINHLTIKVNATNPQNDVFNAVVLANCTPGTFTTLASLRNAIATGAIDTYNGAEAKALPMTSEFTFTGVSASSDKTSENWISKDKTTITEDHADGAMTAPEGYAPIVLERLISRIDVEEIKINLNSNYQDNGSTFKLTKLSLANVKKEVKVAGATTGWLKGYHSDAFVVAEGAIVPGADVVSATLLKEYTKTTAATATYTDLAFSKYVFPNEEGATYQTMILISGIFTSGATGETEERHFRVPIDHLGKNKIDRNYIYKLKVTITGEGSPNEDDKLLNAHISASVTVAPWNVIEQTENDIN